MRRVAARLLATEELSTVLTLSSLTPAQQLNYVSQLWAELDQTRESMGCPHWVLIDEAHYFFHKQSPCLKYLGSPAGLVRFLATSSWQGGYVSSNAQRPRVRPRIAPRSWRISRISI
jgi:hypothetical protein